MVPKAAAEARTRLERARQAASILIEAQEGWNISEGSSGAPTQLKDDDYPDLHTAWWQFLLAAGGVYSRLEQGAKASNKSASWFGREKNKRKTDPLLSYIHHARNSEEHGLEGSSRASGPRFKAKSGGRVINHDDGTFDFIMDASADKMVLHWDPPGIRLSTVRDDRFGDSFDPPREHLGVFIDGERPGNVAKAAIAYLEKIVAEAEALAASQA
ncbi:hypothetical protein [uncultured Sphingomonas sp.]|uniref:hypothetical protein n=1 Tax=uncultured Sphingomonas sp. TaxID=158754 RepID=UPI0025F1B893|nr:hypothetical protein [uncultured Sphingomonas sp.]